MIQNHRLTFIAIATISLMLTACTSSFSASKLGADNKVGDQGGIPYTMLKPQFHISQTMKNGVAAYELQIAYVPDVENQYTIRANPSLFADTDFSIDLSGRGNLLGSKLIATDQVTPTVTAIGTFAIGALTLAAALDVDQGLAKVLLEALQDSRFRCRNDSNDNTRQQLIAFIDDLRENEEDDVSFRQSLHARSSAERECLLDLPLSQAVKSDVNTIMELPLPEWRARHLAYVQRRISEEVYQAMLQGIDPDQDSKVQQLRLELARTVGEEATQRRLTKIEDQLDLVPPEPSGDISAYGEYGRMRQEATLLRERITAAIGSTLAAVKPKTPDPFTGIVPRAPLDCVTAKSRPSNCPNTDYVIVLERVQER